MKTKPTLWFHDLKSNKSFKKSGYRCAYKGHSFFAVAHSPYGDYEVWKLLSNNQILKMLNQ